MTHTEAGVTIELTKGNIVKQPDVEAIVNAANAQLKTGEAVVSEGHELPNAHVIHVLGPVYGRDEPSDELLRAGYENALARAEENGITSVAFPALSTGAFGYPLDEAARIAVKTILDAAPDLDSVELVRFVLFDEDALDAHEEALSTLRSDP
ncbi:MAG: RNase III inhibitor [Bacteroidetes bacterium QH_6_64_77]|nr:MAG: RNase III inhibitor [Bacteroidetes bacterium QH_6_64_77]